MQKKRILFAVGGTGGHLFPAQEFARSLKDFDVYFAGAHLSQNRFFDREHFSFYDIVSATPFRGNWRTKIRFPLVQLKGIATSIALLRETRPALMLGFGSYHTFPLLCAGAMLRIPIVLVEADIFPGKVNRLFSHVAQCTATLFSAAHGHLAGKKCLIAPLTPWIQRVGIMSDREARKELGLDPEQFTLLAFGGSQGAKAINERIPSLIASCKAQQIPIQCIHLTGEENVADEMRAAYHTLGIPHYVRARESRMDLIWQAASLAVTRAGASTLAEMIAFSVPAILIPFPQAAGAHQEKNARYIVEKIGAGLWISEEKLSDEALFALLQVCRERNAEFRQLLNKAYHQEHKRNLAEVLREHL